MTITPFVSLDYLKTDEELEEYVQERIRLATGAPTSDARDAAMQECWDAIDRLYAASEPSDPIRKGLSKAAKTIADMRRAAMALSASSAATHTPNAVLEWQPIASRPMDGTRYLAATARHVRVVRQADPDDRLPLMDTPEPWPDLPTHWMPLPQPPAAGKGGE